MTSKCIDHTSHIPICPAAWSQFKRSNEEHYYFEFHDPIISVLSNVTFAR